MLTCQNATTETYSSPIAGFKLKPSKCVFFQTSVKYLGHIVSENGVGTAIEKTRAVQDWDRTRTQKQMR
jgi:hypothetical protein